MNARIYKKQNKMAMQYLISLGPRGACQYILKDFYRSERGEEWHVSKRLAKRFPSREITGVYLKGTECESWHIRLAKGTPMFGHMSGYYEPEWDERPAVEELAYYEMVNDGDYWAAEGAEHSNEAELEKELA